jgi:hypothetical protein
LCASPSASRPADLRRWFAAGDPPLSVTGLVPPAGGTRVAQVWYRNSATFCTPATFNLTNGVEVTWAP